MSSIKVDGFESSAVFQQISDGLKSQDSAQRTATVKKVNGLFQLDVKNAAGTVQTWTIDFKSGEGAVYTGKPEGGKKPDVTIGVADSDFMLMAAGKLNGQKAFMTRKISVKGQMMLATKLDTVLKSSQVAAKL